MAEKGRLNAAKTLTEDMMIALKNDLNKNMRNNVANALKNELVNA